MTIVRVKGFQIFKDRHGRARCYHRKTGTAIDLNKAPLGTAEFFAECARISALTTATTPKPGTLGMLISGYRDHPAFREPRMGVVAMKGHGDRVGGCGHLRIR